MAKQLIFEADAQEPLDRLREALTAAGRSHDDFEIIITPVEANPDTIAEFADLGVHRLVVHLGSQRPAAVASRLKELEALIS